MSDTPQPRADATADDDVDAFLDALADKYGDLTHGDSPRAVVFRVPPPDRYMTPKTSDA